MVRKLLAGIALLSLSTSAFAVTSNFTGSLDASDPLWIGCGSSAATDCNYDVIKFTVSASGLYDFDAFYPGDTGSSANLDGILEIYENSFDAGAPGLSSIGFSDDGPDGSNTSQILGLSLSTGTTYFAVISSWDSAPTSFGQPNGPWELTINGPGSADPNVVPVPAAIWLMGSGLAGLAALRRRRS